jgi:hypothetical protein
MLPTFPLLVFYTVFSDLASAQKVLQNFLPQRGAALVVSNIAAILKAPAGRSVSFQGVYFQ